MGSTAEQDRHVHRYRTYGHTADPLKGPRLILYAMALLSAGYIIFIQLGGGFVWGDTVIACTLTAAYMVCAIYLPRNPLLFAATPLVLFALANALHFIVDPNLIFRALWMKLLMASGLLAAFWWVLKSQSLKGELRVE